MICYGTEVKINFILLYFIQDLTLSKMTIINYSCDTFIKYELLKYRWKANAL